MARAFALLNMAMHDAAVACWDTKFSYFDPRPSQLDPELKTAVGIAELSGLYVGTFDFSSAAAEVLNYLVPGEAGYFRRSWKKRRCRVSTAASTIVPTSKSAKTTARASAATR